MAKLVIEVDLDQASSGADAFGFLASLVSAMLKTYGFAPDLRVLSQSMLAETKVTEDSPVLGRVFTSPEAFDNKEQIPLERQMSFKSTAVPSVSELFDIARDRQDTREEEKPS